MSVVVPAGKVPMPPTTQLHTVPRPIRERPVAVQVPMPMFRTIQTSTNSGFKCTPRPRCLLSRLRKAGSIGHGVPSRPRSGVTAQPGRMVSCPKKHIRLPSSAEMMCLTSLDCRNTTDFRFHLHLRPWGGSCIFFSYHCIA